jgi:hypothetical protein
LLEMRSRASRAWGELGSEMPARSAARKAPQEAVTPDELDLARAGRAELLIEIRRLRAQVRDYRAGGINLPGWFCERCHEFNGSGKVVLTECRCCGAPQPGGPP